MANSNHDRNPLPPHLDPHEIDRLLTDSPVAAIRSSDGVVTVHQIPALIHKITITEEDLALLDDTEASVRLPDQDCAAIHEADLPPCVQSSAKPDELSPISVADPTTDDKSGWSAVQEAIGHKNSFAGRVSSPPPSVRPDVAAPHRNNLSAFFHGWSTLMGHSEMVNDPCNPQRHPTASGAPGNTPSLHHSQPFPVFSPLLTQSSKIITGAVASLLSPWANAGSTSAIEEKRVEDGEGACSVPTDNTPVGDSFIEAFQKIAVTGSLSEHEEVFFSPVRERKHSGPAALPTSPGQPKTVHHLMSETLEDTQCEVHQHQNPTAESSQYSDAVSQYSLESHSLLCPPPQAPEEAAAAADEEISAVTPTPDQQPQYSYSLHEADGGACVTPTVLRLQSRLSNRPSFSPRPLMVSLATDDDENGACGATGTGMRSKPRGKSGDTSMTTKVVEVGARTPETSICLTPIDANPVFTKSNQSGPMEEDPEEPTTSRTRLRGEAVVIEELSALRLDGDANVMASVTETETTNPQPPRQTKRRGTITLEQPSALLNASQSPAIVNPAPTEPKLPTIPRRVNSDGGDRRRLVHDTVTIPTGGFSQSPLDTMEPPAKFAVDSKQEEDKENVVPKKIPNRRGTHRLPALSVPVRVSDVDTKLPLVATSISTANKNCRDRQNATEVEKNQLRAENAKLRAQTDSLGVISGRYRDLFEEALDHRSRVDFAASSAVAQASDELTDARRQATTLHGGVVESKRRHARLCESIEIKRQTQSQMVHVLEVYKAKLIRQSERGESYQKYCLGKIQKALEKQDSMKGDTEKEVSKLRVQAKQLEMKGDSLEVLLKQKMHENQELTRICDSLLS